MLCKAVDKVVPKFMGLGEPNPSFRRHVAVVQGVSSFSVQ